MRCILNTHGERVGEGVVVEVSHLEGIIKGDIHRLAGTLSICYVVVDEHCCHIHTLPLSISLSLALFFSIHLFHCLSFSNFIFLSLSIFLTVSLSLSIFPSHCRSLSLSFFLSHYLFSYFSHCSICFFPPPLDHSLSLSNFIFQMFFFFSHVFLRS